MAHYVILLKYTAQGIAKIKESPARIDAARKAFRDAGGELKHWMLLIGQYDAMAMVDMPDDMALAKVLLRIAAQGNVQTETLRAFSEEEFKKIVAEV